MPTPSTSRRTRPAPAPASASSRLVVDLALQGGGAHGAFTWGVLERLLDDTDIDIGRISGCSAGALNGAALVTGFAAGGREGARRSLASLWARAWEVGAAAALFTLPLKKPSLGIWDDALPLASPYQAAPMALESLRYLVSGIADFSPCEPDAGPQLFVNAVNVHTCRTRVFAPAEQSVSSIMASACAPFLFPAVMIDGQAYWDGSYGGNPTMAPLFEGRSDADILLVELTPQRRDDVPMTAKNILNRINELACVNGLRGELREIERLNVKD
ncbi:MAG: patatin-like phospholipase family protein, partial [Burkholderiales bacterium]